MQVEIKTLIDGILAGDMLALSKGITLVESKAVQDREKALELVSGIYDHRCEATRIGITGIPGVGKSTFIEQLGLHIVDKGHKLAVLAIDPSSNRSAGSILGDKTRMEELSRHQNAFIRPSPSSGTLGGVAARTREAMLLCEAAGFDVIIIETVGVGQSETEVINLCDTFMMLAMPGTGDDLQGIKRGIMETADLIVINKADGSNLENAQKAKKQIEMALHLFPNNSSGYKVEVLLASALNKTGIKEAWTKLSDRQRYISESGWQDQVRLSQDSTAFDNLVRTSLIERALTEYKADISQLNDQVENGILNPFEAALKFLDSSHHQ